MNVFLKKIMWVGILLLFIFSSSLIFYSYAFSLFFPAKYRSLIQEQAEKYKLDPLLISSIIYIESRFNEKAQSNRGALGLMQIMPPTAQEIAYKKKLKNYSDSLLLTPHLNIDFGCFYFSQLMKQCNANIRFALIAYNAGNTNLKRWLEYEKEYRHNSDILDHVFPETKNYVADVEKIYDFLKLSNRITRVFL